MGTGFEDRCGRRDDADTATAAKLQAGDRDELRRVFRRDKQSLMATAQRIVKDRSAAEDVVQDVFVKLWRNPHSYDPGRGGLANWLHMRCRGVAIDRVRSQSARDRRERFAHVGTCATHHDDYLSGESDVDLSLALANLPSNDRQLIELTFFDGRSYRAAAASLGIPVGTAKSRIRRVLTSLRHDLHLLTPDDADD